MTESSTSIDDLLTYEEEPPEPVRRERGRVGAWIRVPLIAGALTAVTVVGLRLVGVALPMVAVLAAWTAVLVLQRVTARLGPPPGGRRRAYRGGEEDGQYKWGSIDALRASVYRWERPLTVAAGDRDRFREVVLPAIGELVDERLRQRHGCTRATDPDRARALLGETVWAFLARPPRRSPAPREYAVLVAQLEKL